MRTISALVIVAILAGACGGDPVGLETDPQLVTGSWNLAGFLTEQGRFEKPSVVVSMMVEGEGFAGVAGPNHYGASYEAEEQGAFRVMDLVSTDVGGPEAEVAQRYLVALANASRYGVSSRQLLVYTASGATLVFRRQVEVAEQT